MGVHEMTTRLVTYKEDKNGCWNCTSHKAGKTGYPEIRRNNKRTYTHRDAWERHVGKIPNGKCVMHKCDNKMCINPEHLELGTIGKNVHDAWVRGLGANGSKNGSAKLT
jgi:hypothetical protein